MGNLSTRVVEAERLLAMLPGVLAATIEGDIDRATEVRLLVEEGPPVSEILDAARAALESEAAESPHGAFFRVQVASAGDASTHPKSKTNDAAAPAQSTPENGSFRLITHKVRDISPGVIGVDLTLGILGHRFAGGASGKANSSRKNRVPALATLSALASYVRFASQDSGPTLALESVSEFSLGASSVAVVVVSMSGHAAPLIASWPLSGASGPAVVRATLEATSRRITRLSLDDERRPGRSAARVEPAEPARVVGSGGILRQQAEELLESAGPIASARIVLDREQGFRIHVLATSEISRSEVSRMVMRLLEESLGLRVRLDQITVAQSRLSAEELERLLDRPSPSDSTKASSMASMSRLALTDLHIVAKTGGKQEVGVRIVGDEGASEGRCQAAGGGVALLRPLALATLKAVGELMQRSGMQVALGLKDVRRFRRPGDEGVVVLVEAIVDGRRTLASGAAFSANSFERAAVRAVLQATNAFVAGIPDSQHGDVQPRDEESIREPQSGSPASPDSSPDELRGDPPLEDPSDSPRASTPGDQDDYVSQVLSRIHSTPRRLDRAPPAPSR